MSEASASQRGERVRAALAFGAAAGLLLLYALRGGSYDVVARQEVALGLWWVIGLGWALGVLPLGGTPRRSRRALAALGALAAWTAASLLWSDSLERTFEEIARVAGYGGLLALVASLADRRTWRPAAAGLAAAAVLVCALGVDARLDPSVLGANSVGGTFGLQRLAYPLAYWNAVGAWGAMTIAALLAWSAHARTPLARALALAAVPVAATATYLSFSRASVVGVALAVAVAIALGPRRVLVTLHALAAAVAAGAAVLVIRGAPAIERGTGGAGGGRVVLALVAGALALGALAALSGRLAGRRGPRVPGLTARRALIAAGAALLVAGVLGGPSLAERGWRDFKGTPVGPGGDPATRLSSLASSRYGLYDNALTAFTSHPVLGLGAGTFQFWHDGHADNSEFVRDGHSIYLESLAELGVPGLLLVLALLGLLLHAALRARKRLSDDAERGAAAALIATFVVFLWQAGVDWMWETTAAGAFALGAVALAAVPGTRRGQARPRWPLRAAVALVAVLAALVQLPGLVSTSQSRRSAAALRAGAPARALADADDAIAAEPWSASARIARALVAESTGELAGARIDVQAAIAREPENWSHRLVLARVEAERGHAAAALAAFEQARRLRPRAHVFARAAP